MRGIGLSLMTYVFVGIFGACIGIIGKHYGPMASVLTASAGCALAMAVVVQWKGK